MIGTETCYVPNTGDSNGGNNGRRACAYVVNAIVDNALGAPISGTSGNGDSYGRGTREMYQNLTTSNRFMSVGSDISQLQPGDIIISPTSGDTTGHVGIYSSTGRIISNSSSATQVRDNFTPARWQQYYSGRGLGVHIFRPAQVLGN
jgi:cell wall-associated NlpC family hydrolase